MSAGDGTLKASLMTSTIGPPQRQDGRSPAPTLPEGTPAEQTVCLLAEWRERLVVGPTERSNAEAIEFVDRAIATITLLQKETHGLRTALTSRATIDEAKGMIMAERRCDADAAFQVLVNMSRDTNVPLKDVARALVYQAVRGPLGAPEGRP